MTRVFFDMDGVLAEYQDGVSYEELLQKGYFRDLKPQQAVIDAFLTLANNPQLQVYTLSAVLPDNPFALEEKKAWLEEYVPGAGKIFSSRFTLCGESKETGVPGGIQPTDILIDDYNVNLRDWQQKGVAIKLLNGINHKHGSWQGLLTSKDNASAIVNTVYRAAGIA